MKYLNLNFNKLTEFDFRLFESLEELHLNYNKLENLIYPEGNINIKKLYLGYNKELKELNFNGFIKLKYLSLNYTPIKRIYNTNEDCHPNDIDFHYGNLIDINNESHNMNNMDNFYEYIKSCNNQLRSKRTKSARN